MSDRTELTKRLDETLSWPAMMQRAEEPEPEPALHRYVGEGERCELCGQVMIARVHLLGW